MKKLALLNWGTNYPHPNPLPRGEGTRGNERVEGDDSLLPREKGTVMRGIQQRRIYCAISAFPDIGFKVR